MLEIAVCDDDMADLERAVTMLHKIFTSQQIAYHIEQFVSGIGIIVIGSILIFSVLKKKKLEQSGE